MKYFLLFLVTLAGVFGFQAKRAKRKLENYKQADKQAGLTAQVKSWDSSKKRQQEFKKEKASIESDSHSADHFKHKRVL